MTLAGIDVSNFQTSATLAQWLPKAAFVIVKASEGRTFKDPRHDAHVAAARAAGKLVGHYHFARPDNNPAMLEADAFLAAAAARPGEALVLDFEPYNHPIDLAIAPEWILAFAARVTNRTGAPCWLYIDGNMGQQVLAKANAVQAEALRRLPLWKATYAPTYGGTMGWPTVTCWQFTSSPIDRNTFYGDAATWGKLAIPSPVVEPPKPPTAGKIPEDGHFGPVTAAETQRQIRAKYRASGKDGRQLTVDGVWGLNSATALERCVNVWAGWRKWTFRDRLDGSLRPGATGRDVRVLQSHIRAAVTGVWTADTTRALQRALNRNTF
jgi:GH25 family lysozyme M1 (1,4-beta-N-acetylmuramidase)